MSYEKKKQMQSYKGSVICSITRHFPILSKAIEKELAQRTTRYVPLVPDFYQKTGERDSRWKLIINEPMELG